MTTTTPTAATVTPGTDVSRRRRVLLLGTHGQFNIGDELLLETFLDQLGPGHEFVVNSYAPERTSATLSGRFDVDVFDTAGDRRALLRHLVRSDVVVFGGGSIVKELYASVGRWRYSTLVMVLAIVLVAKAARRPIAMVGVGVGPIETRTGRALAAMVLRLVDHVAVRDHASWELCRRLGVRPARLRQVPDTVFANRPHVFVERPEVPERSDAASDGAPLRLALNLNRDIANGDRWGRFLEELETAIDRVAESGPIEVHALPMQSEFKIQDDLTVLRGFLADRPEWNPVIHEPQDHQDVGRIVAGCDVVVSERLHAIVVAAIIGRPAVGLVYDVKVAELVSQLGLAGRSVDVNASVDPGALAEMILAAASDRAVEGPRLRRRAAELRSDVRAEFDDLNDWVAAPRRRRAWA